MSGTRGTNWDLLRSRAWDWGISSCLSRGWDWGISSSPSHEV